jgi:hypothetical protein
MTTSITNPDVPLLAGAVRADDWEDITDRPWRTVYGRQMGITDHGAHVTAEAAQWCYDGSLDDLAIRIDIDVYEPLNSDQARELASALLEAAAEIDRWARR